MSERQASNLGSGNALSSAVLGSFTQAKSDRERELTLEFFRLVIESNDTSELLDKAIAFFKKCSDCEAVGIRLRDGNCVPFFDAQGFSAEFLLDTESLCVTNDLITAEPGAEIRMPLVCHCGDVISGRPNASDRRFSRYGSFWTNSNSDKTLADREDCDRAPRCISAGYESLALIPLKTSGTPFGLIQFSDKREGMFSPEMIALWERLAEPLACALAKSRNADMLLSREAHLRSVFENLSEGLIIANSSGLILQWNRAAASLHGFPEIPDQGMFRQLRNIFELRSMDGRVLSVDEWPISRILRGDEVRDEEFRVRRLDRTDWTRAFVYTGTPIYDGNGRTVVGVITIRDVTERRRAEEALRGSEPLETSSDGLVVIEVTHEGKPGRFLEVNDLICQRLGYSRQELLSMSPMEIADPSLGVSAIDILNRLREKPDIIFDQIHVSKTGARVPVRIHARLFQQHDRPALIALVRDTGGNKRAERALRQSEQRLLQAVKVAGLGIFEYDHNTGLVYCSPTFQSIYGFEGQNVIPLNTIMDRVFPEDREKLRVNLSQTAEPGFDNLYQREHRIMHPEGIRWVLVRAETFFEGEGDARHSVRTVGAIVNITKRKEAELELAAGRQQLRTALDAAKLGVFQHNLQTDTLVGDALANSIYGWAPGTTLKFSELLEQVVPEDRKLFAELPSKVSDGCTNFNFEYRVQCPSGQIRWVTVWGNLLCDVAGTPISITGVLQDITDRKKAEEEHKALEQQFLHAQKMEAVGRLAGGIAHDFNNLLMVIRSYTEILHDSLQPNDDLRKSTEAITKAVSRASSLTGQMLAFSRKQVLSPVPLNLNVAVADAAKMLQRLIGEDIELKVVPDKHIWTVKADPDQISQVLMNLSVNARDAMPQGGTLTISTRNFTTDEEFLAQHPCMQAGDYGSFSVSDTGTGISKEIQERMFEPFFTTKSAGRGTGLGLSTVYGIVKQSGGFVFVESELGRGTCFTVYFPRILEMVPGSDTSKSESPRQGSETLLIVEDDQPLRESISEFLTALGYKVLAAESGQRALEIADQYENPIQALVTDVVMPKLGGRALALSLENKRPGIRTIYMSGYTDDALIRYGVQDLGSALLQKPFRLATLAKRVRELLDSPQN